MGSKAGCEAVEECETACRKPAGEDCAGAIARVPASAIAMAAPIEKGDNTTLPEEAANSANNC